MKTFQLSIKTPVETILEVEAKELRINTESGRMCILPGHAALTGYVMFSKMMVIFEKTTEEFFVKNGILFVDQNENSVQLLCLSCEETSEVTLTTIEEYIKMVEKQIKEKKYESEYQLEFLKKEAFALTKQKETMSFKK